MRRRRRPQWRLLTFAPQGPTTEAMTGWGEGDGWNRSGGGWGVGSRVKKQSFHITMDVSESTWMCVRCHQATFNVNEVYSFVSPFTQQSTFANEKNEKVHLVPIFALELIHLSTNIFE
ncbi:hypothetical protein E3N88_17849 [Mikania micrantha]|uniref:Uncharacterized protein n=1 Tax=Mikania micrantha TaxID=192012 RepID=A0A5N6NUS9_9ASTR|nr:hypothetical protein E3N88_17849 [Mikania micrantha]